MATDALARLVDLVRPPRPAEDLERAWKLATEWFGFEFPAEHRELIGLYGEGRWGQGGGFTVEGPHQLGLTIRGPRTLLLRAASDLHFHSARRPGPWPLWPEEDGSLEIGWSDIGWKLVCQRHVADLPYTVAVNAQESGFFATESLLVPWLLGWLDGEYDFTGMPPREHVEPTFRPSGVGSRLVLAELSPTDLPLSDRITRLSAYVRRYHDEVNSQMKRRGHMDRARVVSPLDHVGGRLHPPIEPVAYQAAPWRRLDFQTRFSFWYDDATDDSGRHRLCCRMPGPDDLRRSRRHQTHPPQRSYGRLIERTLTEVAQLLGCEALSTEVI